MSDDSQLGPLIRLWGLTTAQLPDPAETPDNLAPFLISILQEAVPFIDSVAPKDAWAGVESGGNELSTAEASANLAAGARPCWKPKGSKSYPDSAAKVHLTERVIDSSDLEMVAGRSVVPPSARLRHDARIPPETWICRRSLHADSDSPGGKSASWAEFRDAIKDRHAESEEAFTPSVVGARAAVVWDCGGTEAVEGGETWGNFTLRVEEVRHRIGKPVMKDRVFPVLQMTCSAMDVPGEGGTVDAAAVSRREKAEFLVVSITVADFGTASPHAEFSKGKGVVVGAYASVERIRKMNWGNRDIEWIMTTASDARGVLPMWVQTMAVPGQIARDVPLFLSWIAKERKGKGVATEDAATPPPPPPAEEKVGSAAPESPAKAAETAPPAASEGAKAQDAGAQATTAPADAPPPAPAKDEKVAATTAADPAPAAETVVSPATEGEQKVVANGNASAEKLAAAADDVAAPAAAAEPAK